MITLRILIIFNIILSILFFGLTILFSEKSNEKQEKITPFECGFSPFKKARSPFSLRFFLVTLIFLIFDIEIALLLPLRIIIKSSNIYIITYLSWAVVIILLVGLFHEWNQGALEWVK